MAATALLDGDEVMDRFAWSLVMGDRASSVKLVHVVTVYMSLIGSLCEITL